VKKPLALAGLVAAAALTAGVPSCSQSREVSLSLHCGAGIRPAASALIKAFEERTGIKVNANYGGSGMLLGQLSAAKKGDLFMPGAELYVDLTIEKGLADPATKRIVAYFIPVIFVKKGNPENIRSVHDFVREGLRIGLGDERACAIGKKSLKIVEKHGMSFADIEHNVAFRSGTVNELAVAIGLGTVDAVIVWDANARHFAESGTAVEIPLEKNSISPIPIVRLVSSGRPAEAQAFIDFVTSAEGEKILRDHGYTVTLRTD
jgi:molybdate transport system substrate-binding protein